MAKQLYRDVNGKTGWSNMKGASGKTYGNIKLFTAAELADALNDGITALPPPPPPPAETLDELKLRWRRLINEWKQVMFDAGVTFNGVVFQSDAEARENINGLVTNINAGMPLPPGFTFRALDNSDIPMDEATVKAFGATMLAHKHGQLLKSWALKAAVDEATTAEEIIGTYDEQGNRTGGIYWQEYEDYMEATGPL